MKISKGICFLLQLKRMKGVEEERDSLMRGLQAVKRYQYCGTSHLLVSSTIYRKLSIVYHLQET
jgi:hypothetical protein